MHKRQAYHITLILLIVFTSFMGAWVSLHWQQQWRLGTTTALNLSEQQQQRLAQISPPILLEVFTRRNPKLQRSVMAVVRSIKPYLSNLEVHWVNPDTHPDLVQQKGISQEGQAYLSIGDTGQRLAVISPTHLIETILTLTSTQQSFIGFTQGSGERALLSNLSGAWINFYHYFNQSGQSFAVIDPNTLISIPENIHILIVADPKTLNTHTQTLLENYLNQGGNLIYTTDTTNAYLPEFIKNKLNITLYTGKMIDANAKNFGLDNPQMQVIELLGDHDITRTLKQSPLLAGAVGLKLSETPSDWDNSALLWSSENSWNELNNRTPPFELNTDETRGPIALASIFSQKSKQGKQSIILIGDSDLWADGYFNTAGNRQFAEQILNYLAPNASLNQISPQELPDQFLHASDAHLMQLAVLLLFILPLGLIIIGIWWWRRAWV